MGSYIYKVTNKIVKDENGRAANLAVYAYKPVSPHFYDAWNDKYGDEINKRMAWKAKCYLSEKYVKTSKNYTGRVVMEDGGPSLEMNCGTITDDWFYKKVAEKMEVA